MAENEGGGAAAGAGGRAARKTGAVIINPGKIGLLPRELKAELDRRLSQSAFDSYRALSKWLREQGFVISHAALHKYGRKFERRLEAVRLAVAEAKAIVEATGGGNADLERALMTMVQKRLFEVLVALEDNRTEGQPPNVNALARSVSGLMKAGVQYEKWSVEKDKRIAERVSIAEQRVEEARAHGLSADAADQIRAVLMEIRE
jgi:hypothetical protein